MHHSVYIAVINALLQMCKWIFVNTVPDSELTTLTHRLHWHQLLIGNWEQRYQLCFIASYLLIKSLLKVRESHRNKCNLITQALIIGWGFINPVCSACMGLLLFVFLLKNVRKHQRVRCKHPQHNRIEKRAARSTDGSGYGCIGTLKRDAMKM